MMQKPVVKSDHNSRYLVSRSSGKYGSKGSHSRGQSRETNKIKGNKQPELRDDVERANAILSTASLKQLKHIKSLQDERLAIRRSVQDGSVFSGIGKGLSITKIKSHRDFKPRNIKEGLKAINSSAMQNVPSQLQAYEAANNKKLFSSRTNATMLRYGQPHESLFQQTEVRSPSPDEEDNYNHLHESVDKLRQIERANNTKSLPSIQKLQEISQAKINAQSVLLEEVKLPKTESAVSIAVHSTE